MISVHQIHADMKLFPPHAVTFRDEGVKRVIEGVETLGRTFFRGDLRCLTPGCKACLPPETVCLHFHDDTVFVPCLECEDFTLFNRPGGS